MEKTPPKRVSFDELNFVPRFEYGDQAQSAKISSSDDGTLLGTGFVRMRNASIPWTVGYDEVIFVVEGELTVKTPAGDLTAGPKETIWLPAGTELVYEAEEVLVFYAMQPTNWADGGAA